MSPSAGRPNPVARVAAADGCTARDSGGACTWILFLISPMLLHISLGDVRSVVLFAVSMSHPISVVYPLCMSVHSHAYVRGYAT